MSLMKPSIRFRLQQTLHNLQKTQITSDEEWRLSRQVCLTQLLITKNGSPTVALFVGKIIFSP